MEIGLGVLGLAPAVFWALTPKEFDAALSGRFGARASRAPLSRLELDALMQLFPDAGE